MKKILIVLIAIMTVSLSGCSFKEKALDRLADFLIEAYEHELDEKTKNHEVIAGRDTVVVWKNHYQILKGYTLDGVREEDLWITVEDADGMILDDLIEHDSKGGCFYVISEEGYAVIDKNSYCRMYITVPKEDFEQGYKENPDGTTTDYTGYIESKYIEYLDSYEEFSEKERKYFDKLKNK